MSKKNKQKAYHFGLIAEWVTIVYYWLRCYRLVAWRYSNGAGEIDIIMVRGKVLVCIEVKARTSPNVTIYQLISYSQQQRIKASCYLFVAHYPKFRNKHIRYDAVLITRFGLPRRIKRIW